MINRRDLLKWGTQVDLKALQEAFLAGWGGFPLIGTREQAEMLWRITKNDQGHTQITMEAAEDTAFLDAMRRAHIKGALVGIDGARDELQQRGLARAVGAEDAVDRAFGHRQIDPVDRGEPLEPLDQSARLDREGARGITCGVAPHLPFP